MKADITATTKDSNGNDKKKTYKLSKFAKIDEGKTAQTLSRENQSQMLTVSADVDESENATFQDSFRKKLTNIICLRDIQPR